MGPALERRSLQIAVALGTLVPIGAGGAGVILGPGALDPHSVVAIDLDSHGRYLSGLLFAIGLAFLSTVPRIEMMGARFRLLTFVVVVGGLARLGGVVAEGVPSDGMIFALVMELGVVPALAVWRERVERRAAPR